MSTLSHHVPFARLVDLAEDRVAPDEREEIRAHLATCPRCAADIAWLEHVIDLMRTDTAEDPPASLVADVVQLFHRQTAVDQSYPRRRVIAVLRFDSAQLPAAEGRRSGRALERQLLFHAAGLDLDLRITPNGPLWTVAGQVLGTNEAGQVELHGSSGTMRTRLNTQCEFTLPPIPGGNYMLTLQLAELEVEIAGLEIGA